jgi:hypothetical protein
MYSPSSTQTQRDKEHPQATSCAAQPMQHNCRAAASPTSSHHMTAIRAPQRTHGLPQHVTGAAALITICTAPVRSAPALPNPSPRGQHQRLSQHRHGQAPTTDQHTSSTPTAHPPMSAPAKLSTSGTCAHTGCCAAGPGCAAHPAASGPGSTQPRYKANNSHSHSRHAFDTLTSSYAPLHTDSSALPGARAGSWVLPASVCLTISALITALSCGAADSAPMRSKACTLCSR